MTTPQGPPPALTAPAPPGYPPNSRYASVPTVTRTLADGRTVTFLRARIVPQAKAFATMSEHAVAPHDRLDTLAATHYGDSELWWRIADANAAIDPDDLLVAGSRIRIGHPEGLPGVPL